MLAAIPPSKPAYSAYIAPYLRGPYGGLPPALPFDPFTALTPPSLSANPSGSGFKDMKMEPIAKWDGKAKSLRAFLVDCFTHFEFQPERYSTDKRKVITIYQACVNGVAKAWVIIIIEGDYPNLLIDYSTFIHKLKTAFADPNLREQYIHNLTHLK